MDKFLKTQAQFVKAINNGRLTNRLGHATMIEGNSKGLLDKATQYVMAALFCEDFAPCLKCENCQKVINGKSPDVIELDLSDANVKKEDILAIQKRFAQTPLEDANKQIYVIKYVENTSGVAMNTLLKFLEEPNENVYAIFTTLNSDKVLSTITSRTNVYRLVKPDTDLIKSVYYETFNKEDVDLAMQVSFDEFSLQEILESEVFTLFKENIKEFYRRLLNYNLYEFAYSLQTGMEKQDLRLLFELIYTTLKESRNLVLIGLDASEISKLTNSANYPEALDVLISSRLKLDTNMNLALLIDEFAIRLEMLYHESV